MDRAVISDFDRHVLAALRSNAASGRWPTAGDVGAQLGLERDVARSALSRLRGRALAEGDGERPPGFARTWRGEIVLEQVTWREHVVAVRG